MRGRGRGRGRQPVQSKVMTVGRKKKGMQEDIYETNLAYEKLFGSKFQKATGARASTMSLALMKQAIEDKNPWPTGIPVTMGASSSKISAARQVYKQKLGLATKGLKVGQVDLPKAPVKVSEEKQAAIRAVRAAQFISESVQDLEPVPQKDISEEEVEAGLNAAERLLDMIKRAETDHPGIFIHQAKQAAQGSLDAWSLKKQKNARKIKIKLRIQEVSHAKIEEIKEELKNITPGSGPMGEEDIAEGNSKVQKLKEELNRVTQAIGNTRQVQELGRALHDAEKQWDQVRPSLPQLPDTPSPSPKTPPMTPSRKL